MTNRRGRPTLPHAHHMETRRRAHKAGFIRSKRAYFEQVLIANGLWKPGKVERT